MSKRAKAGTGGDAAVAAPSSSQKKPKKKVLSIWEEAFGEQGRERGPDWIPTSEKDLEDLLAQEASVSGFYRWLLALFYEPRAKNSPLPKASTQVMVAPFYVLPSAYWNLLENVETDFKYVLKNTGGN
jgi:hypothetical protein